MARKKAERESFYAGIVFQKVEKETWEMLQVDEVAAPN